MNFSFPYGSINGDRKYKAAMFRKYFASFIGDGVFPDPSTNLQVMAIENDMSATVMMGAAYYQGLFGGIDANEDVSFDIADGVLNRLDRVVWRFDHSQRDGFVKVLKGTPASSPSAPEIQRDSEAADLSLAIVSIPAGATKITQADITDTRMDSTVCGWVAGLLEQIDVTTIFNQYADWFGTIKEQYEAWWDDQHDTSAYITAGNIYSYFTPIVQQIGNGTDKEFTITHGFDEKYPDVKMVVTETGEEVLPDNTFLSETQVKVSFDEYTPAENEFTVIIRR